MKKFHKPAKAKRHVCHIQKGGVVSLPSEVGDFKLGQRVYFHLLEDGVAFAPKPKRTFHGRLLSCRIRRTFRTLALYGPRVRASLPNRG